jgi:hypothetical protein
MKSNLSLLQGACSELLRDNDFWVLGALTDWSFEEGCRNKHLKEVVESYRHAGVAKEPLMRLSDGVNGCLKEILQRDNPDICPVARNKGKGQDLSCGSSENRARAEVKLVYDCTYRKYYPSVAEDYSKLGKVRRDGFIGDLFLVVTFVELPSYAYPPGGPWGARKVIVSGIDAQLGELARWLFAGPVWGAGKQSLKVPSKEVDAMERRFHAVFEKPFAVWPSLKDAAVDAAIWQVP